MDGNHCTSSFTIYIFNLFNLKESAVGSSKTMHLLGVVLA